MTYPEKTSEYQDCFRTNNFSLFIQKWTRQNYTAEECLKVLTQLVNLQYYRDNKYAPSNLMDWLSIHRLRKYLGCDGTIALWLMVEIAKYERVSPRLHQVTRLNTNKRGSFSLKCIPNNIDRFFNLRQLHSYGSSGNTIIEIPDKIGELSKLNILSLPNNELTKIPKSLGKVHSLRELNLRNNRLVQLPDELGQLPRLEELVLCNNQLVTIPDSLGSLPDDCLIRLSGNPLSQLPTTLKSIEIDSKQWNVCKQTLLKSPRLRYCSIIINGPIDLQDLLQFEQFVNIGLQFSDPQINVFPEELRKLSNLYLLSIKAFSAKRTQIEIPDWLSELQNVQELYLQDFELQEIPKAIFSLRKLRILDLGYNAISEIPNQIEELSSLEYLNLETNNISSLAESFWTLSQLRELNLYNNSLSKFPMKVELLPNLQWLEVAFNSFPVTSKLKRYLSIRKGYARA